MKDNKFRGIRIDNGEWVYGYYGARSNPYKEDGLPITHFIVDLTPFGNNVYKETVGQLIGLKDIKLKELYEDDYVKAYDALTKRNFKGYISFANGSFVIIDDNDMIHYRWYDYSVEKIGDIHTNPGLLEVIPDE